MWYGQFVKAQFPCIGISEVVRNYLILVWKSIHVSSTVYDSSYKPSSPAAFRMFYLKQLLFFSFLVYQEIYYSVIQNIFQVQVKFSKTFQFKNIQHFSRFKIFCFDISIQLLYLMRKNPHLSKENFTFHILMLHT